MSLPEVLIILGTIFFGQIFDQVVGQVFDQGLGQMFEQNVWTRKYSVQFYQDEQIQNN